MNSFLLSLRAEAETPRVLGPSGLAGPPRGPPPVPGPCPAVPLVPAPPLRVFVLAAGGGAAVNVFAAHTVVVPQAGGEGLDRAVGTLSEV